MPEKENFSLTSKPHSKQKGVSMNRRKNPKVVIIENLKIDVSFTNFRNLKQYINATKSKNKINLLQKLYTSEAAPNSMIQMVYKAGFYLKNLCKGGF